MYILLLLFSAVLFRRHQKMDKVEKRRSFIINILYAAIWIGIGYLCIKYALGVIWPFVV